VLIEFVDLPRVATDGKNFSEAIEEAIDALAGAYKISASFGASHSSRMLYR
jgi:predicted RNase H-like HicB family nuclease